MPRIRLWLLRRDDRAGVLIGAGGPWRWTSLEIPRSFEGFVHARRTCGTRAWFLHLALNHGFPRLGSLRGCERAHVLAVRTCKHLASVHPRVEKVRPHETVDECYRDASALLRKTRQNNLTGIIRLALVLGRDM